MELVTITISNSKLSFLQQITAIHFPSGTGPAPPPQPCWIITTGTEPSGVVEFQGKKYPYGGANFAYNAFPVDTALTPLHVPVTTPGFGEPFGYFGIAHAMVAIMTFDFSGIVSEMIEGGLYMTLAAAQADVALNAGTGRHLTIVETAITTG